MQIFLTKLMNPTLTGALGRVDFVLRKMLVTSPEVNGPFTAQVHLLLKV